MHVWPRPLACRTRRSVRRPNRSVPEHLPSHTAACTAIHQQALLQPGFLSYLSYRSSVHERNHGRHWWRPRASPASPSRCSLRNQPPLPPPFSFPRSATVNPPPRNVGYLNPPAVFVCSPRLRRRHSPATTTAGCLSYRRYQITPVFGRGTLRNPLDRPGTELIRAKCRREASKIHAIYYCHAPSAENCHVASQKPACWTVRLWRSVCRFATSLRGWRPFGDIEVARTSAHAASSYAQAYAKVNLDWHAGSGLFSPIWSPKTSHKRQIDPRQTKMRRPRAHKCQSQASVDLLRLQECRRAVQAIEKQSSYSVFCAV